MMKTLKDMLIPPYVNEQFCCSEVLLLTVLMYTSSAISKALYELAGQHTF